MYIIKQYFKNIINVEPTALEDKARKVYRIESNKINLRYKFIFLHIPAIFLYMLVLSNTLIDYIISCSIPASIIAIYFLEPTQSRLFFKNLFKI